MPHLQGLIHASTNDQHVDTLLQHLLQISRLDSWVMLDGEQWAEGGLLDACV